MRKAPTFLIAAYLGAAIAVLGAKTMFVSTPRAEAVSNAVSVDELHRTVKNLPVQEIKDPI